MRLSLRPKKTCIRRWALKPRIRARGGSVFSSGSSAGVDVEVRQTSSVLPDVPLTGKAGLWEPRRLRFRLFSATGRLVTTGRRRILRLARHWPWTDEITAALERLALLPDPD
jgi:hypothetical protein